jgi:hypothetical protein
MLAGMGGPQAVVKKLPGGVDAIICLFIRSVGLSKEEQLANAILIQRAPVTLKTSPRRASFFLLKLL